MFILDKEKKNTFEPILSLKKLQRNSLNQFWKKHTHCMCKMHCPILHASCREVRHLTLILHKMHWLRAAYFNKEKLVVIMESDSSAENLYLTEEYRQEKHYRKGSTVNSRFCSETLNIIYSTPGNVCGISYHGDLPRLKENYLCDIKKKPGFRQHTWLTH